MDLRTSQAMLQRIELLTKEYEDRQAEILAIEDTISEDRLSLELLEDGKRDGFSELHELYQRQMGVNQRQLVLLQEQQMENRLEFSQLQDKLLTMQSRLQAAE